MSMVGAKAKERKWLRGYQYQNCTNISTPTAPLVRERERRSACVSEGENKVCAKCVRVCVCVCDYWGYGKWLQEEMHALDVCKTKQGVPFSSNPIIYKNTAQTINANNISLHLPHFHESCSWLHAHYYIPPSSIQDTSSQDSTYRRKRGQWENGDMR